MCCEVRVTASSDYPQNHSQTIIGWCSHNLCDYYNFELSGFLCPQRPCLLSITLACQDLPGDSLHRPSTVPCCIIPIIFLYSPSCLRSFPSNSPIIPHPVLRARSHGLTRPAQYDCVVPCYRSTQRRTRACLDRPRRRRSQDVVWGCYFTVIGRNISLLIGIGPSLPLLIFRSCVLFPFILCPPPPQDSIPILTYLIVRFLCTFFPMV